jgi:hypothetical protein
MNGIYEMEYVKEDGKWKIKKLQFSRNYMAIPGEGFVKPERVAAVERHDVRQQTTPDVTRSFEPGYPSGYIFPFHYKHPVTGKETTEGIRNASLESLESG